MNILDHEIVRHCRANADHNEFNLLKGNYYIVAGEYCDLISEEKRAILCDLWGKRRDVSKDFLNSFENVSYRFHKKLKAEAGF